MKELCKELFVLLRENSTASKDLSFCYLRVYQGDSTEVVNSYVPDGE